MGTIFSALWKLVLIALVVVVIVGAATGGSWATTIGHDLGAAVSVTIKFLRAAAGSIHK